MEYKNFQKYFVQSQVSDEVLAIREEVSEAIKKELQIEHYYKAIEIRILDDFILCECLSDSEFSRLTFQKVNKAPYQNEFSYAEKFHYLAL